MNIHFDLTALHALGKQKNLSSDLLHDAEIHFRILDILRKEFKVKIFLI